MAKVRRVVDFDQSVGRPDHSARSRLLCLVQTNKPAQIAPRGRPLTATFGAEIGNQHCEGGWVMTYDADASTTVREFEHLRSQLRRRQTERRTSNQAMTRAIKMLIGDWHVDELGILTREITARD